MGMQITIDIDDSLVRELIYDYLQRILEGVEFDKTKVKILVKSKQNYKADWEDATLKATYIHYQI